MTFKPEARLLCLHEYFNKEIGLLIFAYDSIPPTTLFTSWDQICLDMAYDVEDFLGKWHKGTVIYQDSNCLCVKYHEWDFQWNEKFKVGNPMELHRFAPLNTYTQTTCETIII